MNAFVAAERRIGRGDGNILGESLGDDLTVEGIAMVEREIKKTPRVFRGAGEDADEQIVEAGPDRAGSELKFADVELNGDFSD